MIALLPGHHSASMGAINGTHSEHAEACILASMLAARHDAAIVTGTLKEKVAQLSALSPALAIELHYGSNKVQSTSGQVLIACNAESVAIATRDALVSVVPHAHVTLGEYRSGGVDFFLQQSPVPSVLVTIDDFSNVQGITATRSTTCDAISQGLRLCGF